MACMYVCMYVRLGGKSFRVRCRVEEVVGEVVALMASGFIGSHFFKA
jgi:hypothetical protein